MIAYDIIVNFCIFSLLKYDSIFIKKLKHHTYVVKKLLHSDFVGGQYQLWSLKFMLIFLFHDTFKWLW